MKPKRTNWWIAVSSALALCSSTPVVAAASIEIRFCPASAIRTYPVESRRELQSLMLQNVAIINHGSATFKIDNIEIELLRSNQVLESRKLDRDAVQRIAAQRFRQQVS